MMAWRFFAALWNDMLGGGSCVRSLPRGFRVRIPSAMGRLDVRECPTLSPHHGYRFSPVRRGKSSSCRTPMRYPWWRPGGDPFGHGPVGSRCVSPPAVTPPKLPGVPGTTREVRDHGCRTRIGLRGDVLLPVDEVGAVRAIFIPIIHAGCRRRHQSWKWGGAQDRAGTDAALAFLRLSPRCIQVRLPGTRVVGG